MDPNEFLKFLFLLPILAMASGEPIERLVIRLEADVRDFLTRGNTAIQQMTDAMNKLDKKQKQVGRFEQLKKGLNSLVSAIRQAQAAVLAFGAAVIAAWRMATQAVTDLRIERSFYSLAKAANQSGREILDALRRASLGAVDDLTLMQKANLAMQLGVAKTPAEFEKLARSAIALGAAVGRGPVEAIDDLIVAAGRRSRLVLDNLGISLSEVNHLIEQFAQQDFGKSADQLTQIQRDMLFTRAAIEAASNKAAKLGGNLEDAGTSIQQMQAGAKNFQTEFNKTSLIFLSLLNNMGQGQGILDRLREGAIAWQRILIQIAALTMAINDTLTQAFGQTKTLYQALRQPLARTVFELAREQGRKLFGGEEAAEEAGQSLGETFAESLTRNLADLEEKFKDILNPEDTEGIIPPPDIPEEPIDDSIQRIKDLLGDYYADLEDLTRDNQVELEELEQEHAGRLAAINRDLVKDLTKLDQETAERRAEIFEGARRDLADLERETNAALNDERADFRTEERRETEDHLRAMRRLTQDYLFDLEDAVKERDARAVVDLQRRFALESQRREEDFNVTHGREREDFDTRLQEIRANEARRRQEILNSQAIELQELMVHDAQRRREIQDSHAEQRAAEMQNYAERQTDLQNALTERLRAIARELADEEKLNSEAAERILRVLAQKFGVGGSIDQLLADFRRRQAGRMTIDIQFEAVERMAAARQRIQDALSRIPRFQSGGVVPGPIGRPQLAVVEGGERIMPVGGGGAPRRVQIEFSGSAPPGIQATERDQIAAVLLDALRETGVMDR